VQHSESIDERAEGLGGRGFMDSTGATHGPLFASATRDRSRLGLCERVHTLCFLSGVASSTFFSPRFARAWLSAHAGDSAGGAAFRAGAYEKASLRCPCATPSSPWIPSVWDFSFPVAQRSSERAEVEGPGRIPEGAHAEGARVTGRNGFFSSSYENLRQ